MWLQHERLAFIPAGGLAVPMRFSELLITVPIVSLVEIWSSRRRTDLLFRDIEVRAFPPSLLEAVAETTGMVVGVTAGVVQVVATATIVTNPTKSLVIRAIAHRILTSACYSPLPVVSFLTKMIRVFLDWQRGKTRPA
jgi:hypothetical protein